MGDSNWKDLSKGVVKGDQSVKESLFLLCTAVTMLSGHKLELARSTVLLLSGVLFAATHLELSQFWGLSLLGFGAGGVAVLSGSTLPAILCHLAYNSSAVALVLLAQR
eukprot:365627-Pelagomonas_calceolata.AAC.1